MMSASKNLISASKNLISGSKNLISITGASMVIRDAGQGEREIYVEFRNNGMQSLHHIVKKADSPTILSLMFYKSNRITGRCFYSDLLSFRKNINLTT